MHGHSACHGTGEHLATKRCSPDTLHAGACCAQVPLACASGALVGAAALQVLASALAAAYSYPKP